MSTSAIWRKVSLKHDDGFRHPAIEPASQADYPTDCSERECLSAWAQSPAKRAFDVMFVLAITLLLLPLLLVVACLVRLTSRGPAFFLQKRVGRNGTLFTIYKFRTMTISNYKHSVITTSSSITTSADPRITKVGKFLRWWKLDELPQFINVLRGEMSLVGPRPKVPEQESRMLNCRPGITGAATLAFAQEEILLAGIPEGLLDECFRNVLLPLKDTLDANYMARATLLSDLGILQRTAARRWSHSEITHLLPHAQQIGNKVVISLEPGLEVGD
jgi:lipopolysaccharide/colanic/teichoic acid biosynthesis glycosyltransferase